MGSTGTRNQKASQPSTDATQDPDKHSLECCKAIQKAIGSRDHYGFKREPGRGYLNYTLIGSQLSRAEAGRPYEVVPLFGLNSLWLAASWIFKFDRGKYYLEESSLLIFRGLASDDKKSVLLRAEWDIPERTGVYRHAQPHWHIYQSEIEAGYETVRRGFQPVVDVDTESGEAALSHGLSHWNEGPRFHFAMASQWHLRNAGSHQADLQMAGMLTWLEGCLKYIVEQLRYLERRAGTSATDMP